MQDSNRMGNGDRKRTGLRGERSRSRERKAVRRDLIEIGKDVIAKAGREQAGSWEAGDRRWEKTDLTKSHADPAARVNSIVIEGRRGWSHVKTPRSGAKT